MDCCGLPLIISEEKKKLPKEADNGKRKCYLTNGAFVAAALHSTSNSRCPCTFVV